jgi:hypothetical protein
MPEEEESGFTVRDRRRVHIEDTPAAPEPTPAPATPTLTAAEQAAYDEAADAEAYAAQLAAEDDLDGDEAAMLGEDGVPNVYQVLAVFLNEMRTLALVRLGLVAPPGGDQQLTDLAQAKVAIDTVAYLAAQMEPAVAPEERLPLRAMVSDLQMAFVERTRQVQQ